jgi:DNA replication and repair protein RecF
MTLANLQIQNLRNIHSARFDFHPHLNFIVGANGTGKTSFLEAIYLLGSGHSFRTREISPLISHESDCLTVYARTFDGQSVSIQKSLSTPTQVRLNTYPCQTSSELAYFLPCQVFYQDLFQIIDAGPSVRRSLLDWGLFHVEHSYHSLLKEYKRALKQRNALLKQRAADKDFVPWNRILVDLALKLDSHRKSYFSQLKIEFKKSLAVLTTIECDLIYYKGWDRKGSDKSLESILSQSHQTDLQRQYTQHGPHQADIVIDVNDFKAKHFLSRGQQKIILFALKLAQSTLLNKSCVFLCDDMASELDTEHLNRLLRLIDTIDGQFFITLINEEHIPSRYQSHHCSISKL